MEGICAFTMGKLVRAMAEDRTQRHSCARAASGKSWNPKELWMRKLSTLSPRQQRDVSYLSSCLSSSNQRDQLAMEAGKLDTQHGTDGDLDQLWKEFFSDPSQWVDHRFDKTNVRYPDFKHTKTQQGLWLDKKSNPCWVKAKLDSMAPGAVKQCVFPWNTRIARYIKVRKYRLALDLFKQKQEEGMVPDKFTFIWLIKACTNLLSVGEGRQIHIQAFKSGFESDLFIGNSLIDMYAKCGSIGDALAVFRNMPVRDVVSWNAMIMGYVKNRQLDMALALFWQMQLEQVESDSITFFGILNACARMRYLEVGRNVHGLLNQSACKIGLNVENSLIKMYGKCNCIEDASNLFNAMEEHNAVSWSTMMAGYVNCGQADKALILFWQMPLEGVVPDRLTFVAVLNACASVGALEAGMDIHEQIKHLGHEADMIVANSLIDMYSKCGRSEYARQVFDKMSSRNIVSWNSMINGYVKCGMPDMALKFFQLMQEESVDPDSVTFVGVLNACANVKALEVGRCVHGQVIVKGLDSDVILMNCLLNMYGKCGSIDDAHTLFKGMLMWDVVSWNAMLMGYLECEQEEKALDLFRQMEREEVDQDKVILGSFLKACSSLTAVEEGLRIHLKIVRMGYESDTFLENCLIDMYSKCGRIKNALRVFNNMTRRDSVSWNAIITGCVKCGHAYKAIDVYHQMLKQEFEPDSVTYMNVLNACASTAMLEEGQNVHAHLTQGEYKRDVGVQNSLVDMYLKCGSLENARKIFDRMVIWDMVSWTTMLAGYAMHGLGKEALKLFERMCRADAELDPASFICLLSSCSHAGLVDEGHYFFEAMNPLYGIPALTDHHNCMFDLLGRAGLLDDAEEMILTFQPSASALTALLGCCKIHGNVLIGERIAKRALELDHENSSGYVLLSNNYAAAAS